jgi:hypothetical protein
MDSFVLVLAEHLHDEIDSLTPDKIDKVGKKEDERIRSDVLVGASEEIRSGVVPLCRDA